MPNAKDLVYNWKEEGIAKLLPCPSSNQDKRFFQLQLDEVNFLSNKVSKPLRLSCQRQHLYRSHQSTSGLTSNIEQEQAVYT